MNTKNSHIFKRPKMPKIEISPKRQKYLTSKYRVIEGQTPPPEITLSLPSKTPQKQKMFNLQNKFTITPKNSPLLTKYRSMPNVSVTKEHNGSFLSIDKIFGIPKSQRSKTINYKYLASFGTGLSKNFNRALNFSKKKCKKMVKILKKEPSSKNLRPKIVIEHLGPAPESAIHQKIEQRYGTLPKIEPPGSPVSCKKLFSRVSHIKKPDNQLSNSCKQSSSQSDEDDDEVDSDFIISPIAEIPSSFKSTVYQDSMVTDANQNLQLSIKSTPRTSKSKTSVNSQNEKRAVRNLSKQIQNQNNALCQKSSRPPTRISISNKTEETLTQVTKMSSILQPKYNSNHNLGTKFFGSTTITKSKSTSITELPFEQKLAIFQSRELFPLQETTAFKNPNNKMAYNVINHKKLNNRKMISDNKLLVKQPNKFEIIKKWLNDNDFYSSRSQVNSESNFEDVELIDSDMLYGSSCKIQDVGSKLSLDKDKVEVDADPEKSNSKEMIDDTINLTMITTVPLNKTPKKEKLREVSVNNNIKNIQAQGDNNKSNPNTHQIKHSVEDIIDSHQDINKSFTSAEIKNCNFLTPKRSSTPTNGANKLTLSLFTGGDNENRQIKKSKIPVISPNNSRLSLSGQEIIAKKRSFV